MFGHGDASPADIAQAQIANQVQHEAAFDLVEAVKLLGHYLHDPQVNNEDFANVRVTLADGQTSQFLASTRPGAHTLRFITQLIQNAIPGLLEVRLDDPQDGPRYRATHGAEEWSLAEIEAQQNVAELRDYGTAA
ncbi:hypothetical protein ACFVWP_46925 [Streptomyces sp. NPDC058175]|uniref:hypothetical protein n=1 Tax=Streptomyces sp. NPDC058175 TaxID=3346367 RepID=UPI0036EF0032